MVREVVEDTVKPSQRRIIEVQARLGDMSQLFLDLERKVTDFHRQVNEAMGLGKGGLKGQIMHEVFKFQKSLEGQLMVYTKDAEHA